jgi:hypothetical protein
MLFSPPICMTLEQIQCGRVDVIIVDGHCFFFCFAALADDGKFLLAARRSRRPAGTEHLISLAKNTSKGTCIGKLR